MFASLKNKIKEETGSDPTKVVASPNLPKPTPSYGELNYIDKHSKSNLSTSSETMSNNAAENSRLVEVSPDLSLSSKIGQTRKISDANGQASLGLVMEEELAKQLQKKEKEWNKLMAVKEAEWSRSLKLLEKEKAVLEEEKRDLLNQNLVIEDSLKAAEDYKKKIFQYREDIDQLEGFQTQELAKIKHLLLAKEQEATEMASVMKENAGQMEMLQSEVKRLQRFEAELINVQDEATDKIRNLTVLLVDAEKQAEVSKNECTRLSSELEDARGSSESLDAEVSRLQDQLEQERVRASELGLALQRELGEKDATLLRNAQLNQDVDIARQDLRAHETESADFQARLTAVETTVIEKDKELKSLKTENTELLNRIQDLEVSKASEHASCAVEHELRRNISDLEEQLAEKMKAIKVLQQHMGDLKKTLQRELRQSGEEPEGGGAAILTPSSNRHIVAPPTGHNHGGEEADVNFKYLKHVIIKFLTSREYEAQHLTRAVATLLRFSPEEERLLRETLDWKMSWFGTRPRLGFGQTSKTIPPS